MAAVGIRSPARHPMWAGPDFKKFDYASATIISTVGLLSHTYLSLFTRLQVLGYAENLSQHVHTRQGPLLTYSNHTSTVDDPLHWGAFPAWDLIKLPFTGRMRWSLAADDICFTRKIHAKFFSYGQSIPIHRGGGLEGGGGIMQVSMNHALDIIDNDGWLHMYPEGKVNYVTVPNILPFRWGIGRLVMESLVTPTIIPIFHYGTEKVMPEGRMFPDIFHRHAVTIAYGKPVLGMDKVLQDYRDQMSSLTDLHAKVRLETETRIKVTAMLQEAMEELRLSTAPLHESFRGRT